MKLLALDIATQTGICVGTPGADPKSWSVNLADGIASKVPGETPEKRKARFDGGRFSNALHMTHGLIEKHSPDLIVVEAFIGGQNASAYLIGLVACVRGCASNRGVNVEMVFPATVRKHFIGKAMTSRDFPGLKQAKAKLAIKQVVMDRCKLLGWEVPDLDASDAAATWDWGCAVHARGFQAKPTGGLFK